MKQLSILLCLITCSIYSQNCKHVLKGNVKDFHNGSAIQNATLYIEQLNKYTTTNNKGEFIFNNICSGSLVLVVSHISCETKTITMDIKGDVVKDITLEHHIEELNEVTVTGAINNETSTGQESLIKSDVIEDFSSSSLGDVLKTVSGVSSINTGNTIVKPVINGLHSSRIIIMSNGVRLQDQEWGIEHAPNIDVNASENISVIKGANALVYGGDAIGGTIVLKPKRAILVDSLFGKAVVSGQSNGSGISISSSLSKTFKSGWFITGQGTYKRFGDFDAPDYYLTNTGLDSKSFSLNGGYKSFEKGFNLFYSFVDNEIGILRASHIGNVEDLVNAINTQQPLIADDFSYDIVSPRQEVTHQLLKAEVFKRIKAFGKLTVQYDFQNNQRFEYDVRRLDEDSDKAAVDLKLTTHSVSTNLKVDNDSDYTLNTGLVGRFQNNFANPKTGVRRLIPDYDKYDLGAYIIADIPLSERMGLNVGARYDFNRFDAKKFYEISRWEERNYDQDFADIQIANDVDYGDQLLTNPVFNYHNISASAGITFDVNKQNEILFNYSLSNRAPNPSELFSDGLHHSAARIEIGDLRIEQETSNRFSGTYSYKSNRLSLGIESFLNLVNGFIYLEPSGTEQTIRGAFPVWEYKQTNASLIGVDVTGTYAITENFSFSNNSSLIKGWDQSNDKALIDMPAFKTVNTLSFNKESWNNLDLSLSSEIILKQNEFPNNDFEAFIPTTNETVLVMISEPTPAYHLLHFNSSVDFEISEISNITLALNVNNLLNTSYRDYLNRLRYFADDLGRNIQLQLKINF